jgi:O-antigen ligase/tetratricopeptide (TPR) repeat protein
MKDVLRAIVLGGLFAVPLLTLYVADSYFFPYITGKNFWFRILVDITVAAWILLALYDARYRPRFSWMFVSFSALLIVMFFANFFGEHPLSSFWSNYERMDGYVSLVHTFLYMVVLGSVLKTKEDWGRLLHMSLGVSFLVALYGLAQYSGLAKGTGRIDSTLGNAAYMAVYMLFHIFIAFWLFVESKNKTHKIIYGILAAVFTFVLIETGTRGTALGLAVGILVMSGYVGLFGTKFVEFRKYAIGAFALLVIGVAGFVVFRDSAVVQSNPNLARIANISINDLAVRGTIWGMAWEGVQERPLLGWGQSNFNYVFNTYYEPSLYAQEQWFDRSHNIVMDWLIAGGFLGLIAYFSLFAACLYYLFLSPLLRKDDERFTVLERGVLLGILAGYLTHNFVVFDNIVSYIFFAIILGLIHARVSEPIKEIETAKVDEAIIIQFATPVVGALLIGVIYFAYVPGMAAAKDIIQAISSQSPEVRLKEFDEALSRDSFGRQEIVEQLSQNAVSIIRDQKISAEVKQQWGKRADEELLKLAEDKPGDARIHVFIGTFYRATNQLEKAAEQMAKARELSPEKQSIMIQQGFIALSLAQNDEALQFFKEAYDLDTRNLEAREYYAAGLFYAGKTDEAVALMDSDAVKARFAASDFLLGAANQAGAEDFLIELFKERLVGAKDNAQNWATLAFLYHETGNKEAALKTLEDAKVAIPSFTKTATCISENIKNNRVPDEGCSQTVPAPAK